MAKKSNNNVIIGVGVAVIVVIIAVVVAVVVGNNSGNQPDLDEDTIYYSDNGDAVNYSNVDVSVAYGDYDEMFTQSKAIQNGEMVGKIIQVDGIVYHPMSSYSIVQEDEDGQKIGTVFEIEGADEDAYPNDGDHVIITGEVVEKSPMYFIIKTTPKYVKIVEAATE